MMVKEVNKANNGLSGWVIVQPVTGAAQAQGILFTWAYLMMLSRLWNIRSPSLLAAGRVI